MSTVADRMFRGSFGAMASFLVSRKLSDNDVAALRRMLDEQEAGPTNGRGKEGSK